MTGEQSYYSYWGKARKEGDEGDPYHLLPYHCLDVAAVADVWWENCSSIRRAFLTSSGTSVEQTLKPVDISLQEIPPSCNSLLAGLCSVADWLGSNSDEGAFEFLSDQLSLDDYYKQRLSVAKKTANL